ncbi:MAG TPA: Flp pilus assembly protein CpaB [Caulobacteraceae bacterium]
MSLGASAVLGVGALIVARVWLPQPNHAATPGAAAAPAVQTAPVVVASADIPYGGKLDAAHLTVEQLPIGDAPQGAFTQPAQLLNQTGGPPIALQPIAAREPILPTKISGAGARPTVAAVIGQGMRAYTIGVSDVAGVGGHALPGDRVDVMLTREAPQYSQPANNPNAPVCTNCKHFISDVVLQNVRVLGMDLNADPSSTQAAVAHTATLEVSVLDAQKLSVASQSGSLSLALRRTGAAEIVANRTIAVTDLVGGGRFSAPRVVAVRHVEPTQAPAALIQTHSVTVVHGDSSSSVVVPSERFGAGA